uniref:FXYD domain-containing ion transport regulator n=1 Tax=Ascaris lumbricoides TaxID=6252 RepID=A0A0M3IU63_ASCLU
MVKASYSRHESSPVAEVRDTEALPDVVFGIVSEQKWALKVGDAMVMLCVTFLVVLVVVHQERLILLRRTFFIVG